MKNVATKKNPKLWEKAKRKALIKNGKHGAYTMALATKYYKEMGGKYKSKKSKRNELRKTLNKGFSNHELLKRIYFMFGIT
jgi:hypothetical protein